jgi:ELWxxDGT repeat protein
VLWKSDGTTAGTVEVATVPGPQNLKAVGNTLYFSAAEPKTGRELWVSDGTAAGTRLLRDINPGPTSANPRNVLDNYGYAFFAADDGVHGEELWLSDGSPGGAWLVKDINPGPASSSPEYLTEMFGCVMFSAFTPDTGRELWISVWDEVTTVLLADINPGPASSSPNQLTYVNGMLFFGADDGYHGNELWLYFFDLGPGGAPGQPPLDRFVFDTLGNASPRPSAAAAAPITERPTPVAPVTEQHPARPTAPALLPRVASTPRWLLDRVFALLERPAISVEHAAWLTV